MKSAVEHKGEIIIYQTPEGKTELEVKLERVQNLHKFAKGVRRFEQ